MGLALGITGAFYVRRHVQTQFTQLFNVVEATVQQHGRSVRKFGDPLKLHYPSPPPYTTRLSTRVHLTITGTKDVGHVEGRAVRDSYFDEWKLVQLNAFSHDHRLVKII